MCSQDPPKIEAVKNAFLAAGIVAETRHNPVAEALGISGIELWVMDERDFFNASKLYAELQDRPSGRCAGATAFPRVEAPDLRADPKELEARRADRPNRGVKGSKSQPASEPQREELEQASSLLEKEVDEMLERESGLVAECASLRSKMKELDQALAEGRAAFARETESRAAAEREQAEKLSGLQSALECERAERARAQEQLGRKRYEWQQQLNSRDDALKETQKQLDSKSQLLETQQAAIVDLRDTIVALERQRAADEKSLSGAREEAVMEREARLAAEERARVAAGAQKSLEKQLLEQKDLEQSLQAHVASMNSLCGKLQAKRVAIV
jgi:chromosome segregation ATPase